LPDNDEEEEDEGRGENRFDCNLRALFWVHPFGDCEKDRDGSDRIDDNPNRDKLFEYNVPIQGYPFQDAALHGNGSGAEVSIPATVITARFDVKGEFDIPVSRATPWDRFKAVEFWAAGHLSTA
jgi:hypothetical protein